MHLLSFRAEAGFHVIVERGTSARAPVNEVRGKFPSQLRVTRLLSSVFGNDAGHLLPTLVGKIWEAYTSRRPALRFTGCNEPRLFACTARSDQNPATYSHHHQDSHYHSG